MLHFFIRHGSVPSLGQIDAGVDHLVEEIHHQVHEHDKGGQEDNRAHNQRIVQCLNALDKEFTKADLEDGMVVEQKNGNMYLVLAGKAVRKGRCNRIDGYTDDLKWEGCTGYTGGDIVKVYRITPESLGCIEDVFIKSNLELIWERKEPKKMTVEEMRQKLEELTGEEIEVTA